MKKGDLWRNPFGLNERVVISGLGVGTGFKYATVYVQGPE